MAEILFRFISGRLSDSSILESDPEKVYRDFIVPVVTSNIEGARVSALPYDDEPGLSSEFIEHFLTDDVVIADLTNLNSSAYFKLGARIQAGKPVIFIADGEMTLPLHPLDLDFVPYRFEHGEFQQDGHTAERLLDAINHALAQNSAFAPTGRALPARTRRAQMVARLDEAAEAIRFLRINSAAETANELETIARELESLPENQLETALKETASAFLALLSRLVEQVGSVRGARMLISGVIGIVLGGSGTNAVIAYGLSLAFWEGREAFLKAIERWKGK